MATSMSRDGNPPEDISTWTFEQLIEELAKIQIIRDAAQAKINEGEAAIKRIVDRHAKLHNESYRRLDRMIIMRADEIIRSGPEQSSDTNTPE